MSAVEFAKKIHLSPSYLTEIEKGRKYPKVAKIMAMARALDKEFDDLVSIKLGPSLAVLETMLASPLVQQFPFAEFGVEIGDLATMLTRPRSKPVPCSPPSWNWAGKPTWANPICC